MTRCWLDCRIPGFSQDVRAFLHYKTNRLALLTVAGYGVFWAFGLVDASTALQAMLTAALGITLKDGQHRARSVP